MRTVTGMFMAAAESNWKKNKKCLCKNVSYLRVCL